MRATINVKLTGLVFLGLTVGLVPLTVAQIAPDQASERADDGEAEIKTPVGSALDWLAAHQLPDGSWSFDHRGSECRGRCSDHGSLTTGHNAATAMALLPFFGAGETHQKGQHEQVIRRGLSYLIEHAEKGRKSASFVEPGGTMYSHGLCAIALCEAYASSEDKALEEIAQWSLNFIVEAQDPVGGGWRYAPRQPGDTSVSGWQVSAMYSGQLANLKVSEKTIAGASRFLDSVQSDGGARYGYTTPGMGTATTSIGLLSRFRLGWQRDHEAIERGVEFLRSVGPSRNNMYYNYYASQVMFQYGGRRWQSWRKEIDRFLVKQQDDEGHQAGSWAIGGGHTADRGGRLCCTSLAALTLEIEDGRLAMFRLSQESVQKAAE